MSQPNASAVTATFRTFSARPKSLNISVLYFGCVLSFAELYLHTSREICPLQNKAASYSNNFHGVNFPPHYHKWGRLASAMSLSFISSYTACLQWETARQQSDEKHSNIDTEDGRNVVTQENRQRAWQRDRSWSYNQDYICKWKVNLNGTLFQKYIHPQHPIKSI